MFLIAITSEQDLLDIIAILIIINILYKDFDTIIASLLKVNDKIIDQI